MRAKVRAKAPEGEGEGEGEAEAPHERRGYFAPGTPILMADRSFTPIEAIQPGDMILSRNLTTGNLLQSCSAPAPNSEKYMRHIQ